MSKNWKRDEHFQFFTSHNYTLTMRQISVKDEVNMGSLQTTPTITITSDIFDFLGYEGAPKIQQQNFER